MVTIIKKQDLPMIDTKEIDYTKQLEQQGEIYAEGYKHAYHMNFTLFFSKEELPEPILAELKRATSHKIKPSYPNVHYNEMVNLLKEKGYEIQDLEQTIVNKQP